MKASQQIAAKDIDDEYDKLIAENEELKNKVSLAYGYLWHVNNNPDAPMPLYSTEKAGYEARKILRDTMTHEQRGEAINKVSKFLTV